MGGIGVIYNPLAGKNRKDPRREAKFRSILGDNGLFIRCADQESLLQAAENFLKNKIDIVAVSGGDGTLHQVFSAVINHYGAHPLPQFACLRSGTMNTVTNSIKVKGTTAAILKKIVEHYRTSQPFTTINQHLMKVNNTYGFMTGAGVIASFLSVYYSTKRPGPVHAAAMVSRMILSAIFRTDYNSRIFYPIKCRLVVDGQELPQAEYLFILGCAIRELGLGFTPTPRAYEKPGHFHLLAGSMTPPNLVSKVPAIWLGRDIRHPRLYYNGIAANMVLEPEESIPWMIDGDIYTTDQPLSFSVGPTIRIISPALPRLSASG